MKALLLALTLGAVSSTALATQKAEAPAPAASAPKYKEVCKVKEGKKTCKTIRVHKKLDGKPVPTK